MGEKKLRYLRKAVCLLLALSLFLGLAPGRGQALETTDVPETAETAPTGTGSAGDGAHPGIPAP